jgi:hypothetical protein
MDSTVEGRTYQDEEQCVLGEDPGNARCSRKDIVICRQVHFLRTKIDQYWPGFPAASPDLASATVRRRGFWNRWPPEQREDLAHLVGLIMRRVCGEASAGVRWDPVASDF